MTRDAMVPAPPGDPPGVALVVDDDDAVAGALARLIRSAGYDARTFSSGSAFLESFTECPRGCLVLDINMPGMSGHALHRELRARGWGIPVIYVTGHAFPGGRAAARDAGARALFLKPVEPEPFLEELASALEGDG